MHGSSRKNRIKHLWKRIVAAMCCFVVFITTYALILPAITLDNDTTEEEPGIVLDHSSEEIPHVVIQEGHQEQTSDDATDTEEQTGDQQEDPELCPACTLKARAGDVLVTVDAPEGAFPEDVIMAVSLVENESVIEAIAGTVDGRVRNIQAVDITFFNGEGIEIQPGLPIRVSMSSEITENAEELQVVHVDDELKAEVVEDAEPGDGSSVEFSAGQFSVYAIVEVETISGTYLMADGSTYEVTVTYSEDAGIPADAILNVRELTEYEDYYASYVLQAAEAIEADESRLSYVKLLDITITDAEGAKIEPAVPVDVKICLLDKNRPEETVQVIHFGSDTEVLESSTDEDTVTFSTEGFSVYAVVTVSDVSELDGKAYGILNTQDGDKPYGKALQSAAVNNDANSLQLKETTVKTDIVGRQSNVYVANNSNITMWSFHLIENGRFYVTADVDGALKYLKISSTGLSLVDPDELDDDCKITVTKGTGSREGKYKFSTGNGALGLNGSKFSRLEPTTNNNNVWLNLAELSNLNDDDFVVYTADKVSVSGKVNEDGTIDYDVKDGEQLILYTRIWNDDSKRYDYYIVDYDGKLVKAYESGDTISWVGSKVNTMLWDFTEYHYDDGSPNYYYELQNNYSGRYIAPQVSGTAFLSDSTIGINLNGRRYGEYYTTVLAWDDPYYDYASLKVRDGQLVSAPMTRADDFYFAVMSKKEETTGNTPTPVATLDHTTFGITLKMQDYGNINSNNRSQTQVDVLGNTSYQQWTGTKNLLERNFTGDYPVATYSSRSLSELYSQAVEVNQQFISSTYKETGYFEYDSTQNFAHLITGTDDYWYGKERPDGGTYGVGDFVIYNELGTSSESNKDTLKHGQFLPYNDLMVKDKNGQWVPRGYSTQYVNERDISANPLSSLDPRNGEKLYEIPYRKGQTSPGYVNHFFGMEMSASFMQSESGLDAWGHDLIFEFSGDDDFWLYIDGMLVLDLGGIHSALNGSVNFRTGVVIENCKTTTLRELYKQAYLEKNPNASDDAVNDWLNSIFEDDGSNTGTVFKDYTGHTMRMFYMERGAGASNLHMRFNLTPYVNGEVLLEKEVSGTENIDMEFPFQIWYKNASHMWVKAGEEIPVTDSQTGESIKYQETYSADGLTYENVFFLNKGQTASIKLPSEDTEYYITECALDTGIFDKVTVNGEEITPSSTSADGRKDYSISETIVAGRKKVIYDNHVSSSALKSLNITKRLWQDNAKTHEILSGTGEDADNTEFRFRVYIGSDSNGNPKVYNTGKYYIRNPEGEYCIYQNGQFVSTGETDFSHLSTDAEGDEKSEQEKATFHSSPGGAIDKIKAGYIIEIPGLLPETAFKVVEQDNEIPSGYNLLGYTLTNGQYSSLNQGDASGKGKISSQNDWIDTVSVHNQHGYGLIVNKIWSDAAFMSYHDPIYFAVFDKETGGLVTDTVRRLSDPDTSVRWFFPELAEGKKLNDYEIYELDPDSFEGVQISVDDSGVVTGYDPTKIVRKNQDDTIDVISMGNEHGYPDTYTYTVGYRREWLTYDQIAANINSRTDNVSNSRAGIRLIKTNIAGEPLEGAVFVFTDPDGNRITFTSDENGLIVVAYLLPDNTYTVEETAAPYGYRTWIGQFTIKVGANGTLFVNGEPASPDDGNGPYTLLQVQNPTPAYMPQVTIRNKPVEMKAVKTDAESGQPMEGVRFALYREVKEAATGNPMPDYTPMEGYEDLVTDEDGIIPKMVLRNSEHPDGLKPGIYYLREKEAPALYDPIGYDIRITISSTGSVSLEKAKRPEQSGSWIISEVSDEIAQITEQDDGTYLLTVKNQPKQPVRIKKINTDGKTLSGVQFALYIAGQSETPILEGQTDEDGILNLGALQEGITYYLYETQTLDGYRLLEDPVLITKANDDSLTASVRGTPLTVNVVTVNGKDAWEITVYNYTSAELPATGGSGTLPYLITGSVLTGVSVTVLTSRKRKRKRIKGREGP